MPAGTWDTPCHTAKMEIDNPIQSSKKPDMKSSKIDETGYSPYPDMNLAQSIHRVTMISGNQPILDHVAASSVRLPAEYVNSIFLTLASPQVENPSLYRLLKQLVNSSELNGSITYLSSEDLDTMENMHRSKVSSLEAKIEEAKEKSGDSEVLDALFELARFAAKSLTKAEALDAYDRILKTPKLSSGKSMDALMESARVASFYGDVTKCEDFISKVRIVLDPFSSCVYNFYSTFLHFNNCVIDKQNCRRWGRLGQKKQIESL
jgi:26S proteasome regulatory subunit N7